MALAPCTRHLRDYVAIPSVNPMGRDDLPAGIAGERRYAEHLREQLRRLGLDAELVGEGERASVVAEARAQGAGDTVLVASHLDTVPVDGMEIDPFDPEIRDGRLYGRGSCDTKGGMAALLAALEVTLERGTLRRNVIVVGKSDEELGSRGVRDVLAHLGGRRPDWVLATEPTELRLVTRHKGIALARLVATGRACHSSNPDAGRNAIVALARATLVLDALNEELRAREDPRLGPGTLSVGLVGGGQAPNIVPDAAWLVSDRRLLPGESGESVRAEIEAALSRAGIEDVAVESCRVEKGALATPDDHPCVRACLALLAEQGLPSEPATASFGTDAGVFAESDLPGVVWGPGSIEQAHTSREFVAVDQLEAASAWLVRLLESDPA
ncbi:MAG: M20/M25/M40 family metallo-hydrolase [Proteobacteria bacterium]|nr:M20/M25/M40 family metallo-hydrolase [Pseudomonadota bacterium]